MNENLLAKRWKKRYNEQSETVKDTLVNSNAMADRVSGRMLQWMGQVYGTGVDVSVNFVFQKLVD